MSDENVVFRKIKEISARSIQPRPTITRFELASELVVSSDCLKVSLAELKQLRLVNFCGSTEQAIRLTLLGSVVKRDK